MSVAEHDTTIGIAAAPNENIALIDAYTAAQPMGRLVTPDRMELTRFF